MSVQPFYVLIHGSRVELGKNPELNKLRVELALEDEILMTFDRLKADFNSRNFLFIRRANGRFRAISFPSTARLGPHKAEPWLHIQGKCDASRATSGFLTSGRPSSLRG